MQRSQHLLLLLAPLCLASFASAQLPQYTVELIATATAGSAFNDSGVVVGTAPLAPASERAWVAHSGSPQTPLPLPPGRISSRALDINGAGVIAGTVSSATYGDPSFGAVAALWFPVAGGGYTVQELGKLPGDVGSAATALNDRGDVVGYSTGTMFRRAVWFTAPGGILDLNPTGAFDPMDINDQRVLVCYSTACSRLDLDTMVLENLGVPIGTGANYSGSRGIAINAANQVAGVGVLATATSCVYTATRFTDVAAGSGWEVFSTCGPQNGCGSINDIGDVTLRAGLTPSVRFEGLGTASIESLIVAPVGHWSLFAGSGLINNARQIVVSGTNPTLGQSGVLLLTPIATTGTPVCDGGGASGPCPCANGSAAGALQGCAHSTGEGARLHATGSSSIAQADLVLRVAGGPPNKPVIFLQGLSGPAVPLGAGLRCVGSPIKRLEARALDGIGATSSSVPIAIVGGVMPGDSRVYQAWFRDPSGPCGQPSNLTGALRIDWQ